MSARGRIWRRTDELLKRGLCALFGIGPSAAAGSDRSIVSTCCVVEKGEKGLEKRKKGRDSVEAKTNGHVTRRKRGDWTGLAQSPRFLRVASGLIYSIAPDSPSKTAVLTGHGLVIFYI